MTHAPGLDPFAVLGVGPDADEIVIQLAYRARIREVHPDIAGAAGLVATQRLNAARDMLLDPLQRARFSRTVAPEAPLAQDGPRTSRRQPGWRARTRRRAHAATTGDRAAADPYSVDFGPRSDALRAFFRAIGSLSRDERARVNHSLGDARPVTFEGYTEVLGPELWGRSQALREAVSAVWEEGVDEGAPVVFPLGRIVPTGLLVANAYAQWILLGDFLRGELGDVVFRDVHVVDAFAMRCVGPWEASVRHARYGPHDRRVRAFLRRAEDLSADAAERLARAWHRHLGRDGLGNRSDHIGPGVWLPAPPNIPEVLKVSGFLAAIDASRILPPEGLDDELLAGYRFGLRITAHALALGLVNGSTPDYLLPWREAIGPEPSLWSRLTGRSSAA